MGVGFNFGETAKINGVTLCVLMFQPLITKNCSVFQVFLFY